MPTRTHRISGGNIFSDINAMEDAGWSVRLIVQLTQNNFLVVFERGDHAN